MRRPPGPRIGRPADLPPPAVICARNKHKHGTKMRYLAGCRCWRCRRGNRDYERKLQRDRERFGPNDLVSTARVLEHLRYLKTFGMGFKTVAKHAGVGKTVLGAIIWPGKEVRHHIRRRSEARVLAVQPSLDTLSRNVNVPAAETLQRIEQLVKWGYSKALISADGLGNDARALQVNKTKSVNTTVRTAVNVKKFYELVLAMREVWQKKRQIPARHYIYWKASRCGRRPAIPMVRWLELRPFQRGYDYHYVWTKELKQVSGLVRKLTKSYREKEKSCQQAKTS